MGREYLVVAGLVLAQCGNADERTHELRERGFPTAQASALEVRSDGGSFTILTYNVAGLPEPLSGSEPAINTPLMGPLLAGYDFVHVQEDFNYHAALYANDIHPYRSSTSGGVPFGDGLNTLSYAQFSDFERVTWDACNGADCLTPKGFSYARHRLSAGVYVDFYNLHANANNEAADLAARRDNILQLLAYLEQHSLGNAVVVMGDTNTRYTREGDNIAELAAHGFSDAWVELTRDGVYPQKGEPALSDCPLGKRLGGCEVVDKIFYRSNRLVRLEAIDYHVEDTAFLRADGERLSDHNPVFASFEYTLAPDFHASDLVGGPHGAPFNDLPLLPQHPSVRRLTLRTGSRVDRVALELNDGRVLAHGGAGGTERSLALEPGENLHKVELCTGQKDGHTRVFFASFTSDRGRSLQGGSRTGQCTSLEAPSGFQIAGFYGRSGSEVDKLGALYARL